MSQAVAVAFPLPVALALGAVLLVLLAVTAILVSLRKPARVRKPAAPDWVHGREPMAPFDDEVHGFRLGHLRIDSLSDLSGQPHGPH
ncbi:hypothetical protein [Massilia sp. ST3]|uniref:hypothetical protein n=1 Tax=Massilia sp. ST3 TaxID=2824903 RepID=UPI001B839774|nr:hypothetical protein [Massilia sp. ST3]MBQ5948948.1 hypothetical protein [Massilia sp. ST3]